MEILRPAEEQSYPSTQIPSEMLEAGINLKNLEMLDYLGMKDEMFNPSVMDKISFLSDYISDVGHLRDVDMRLGTEQGISKLDKIYAYTKLDIQSRQLEKDQELIRSQMRKYE